MKRYARASQRKIITTVIPLGKKTHVFHHENIANQKDGTLSLHDIFAVLSTVRDGRLR